MGTSDYEVSIKISVDTLNKRFFVKSYFKNVLK